MVKSVIALPAASLNEPALNATDEAVRSEEVSPACTVYVPEAVVEAVTVLIVTVRSVSPVSSVITKLPSANVTASLGANVNNNGPGVLVTCPVTTTYTYAWSNLTSGGAVGLSNPNIPMIFLFTLILVIVEKNIPIIPQTKNPTNVG